MRVGHPKQAQQWHDGAFEHTSDCRHLAHIIAYAKTAGGGLSARDYAFSVFMFSSDVAIRSCYDALSCSFVVNAYSRSPSP